MEKAKAKRIVEKSVFTKEMKAERYPEKVKDLQFLQGMVVRVSTTDKDKNPMVVKDDKGAEIGRRISVGILPSNKGEIQYVTFNVKSEGYASVLKDLQSLRGKARLAMVTVTEAPDDFEKRNAVFDTYMKSDDAVKYDMVSRAEKAVLESPEVLRHVSAVVNKRKGSLNVSMTSWTNKEGRVFFNAHTADVVRWEPEKNKEQAVAEVAEPDMDAVDIPDAFSNEPTDTIDDFSFGPDFENER